MLKKEFKRAIACMLALALLVGMTPAMAISAHAADGAATVEGLSEESSSAKAELTSESGSLSTSVTSEDFSAADDAIVVYSDSGSVSFAAPVNGSYTVAGEDAGAGLTKTYSGSTTWELKATANTGYTFVCWYTGGAAAPSADTFLSSEETYTYTPQGGETVSAWFASASNPCFSVGEKSLDTLADAITFAQAGGSSLVEMIQSYTLSSSCTIPSGVTVVVPYAVGASTIDSEDRIYSNSVGTYDSNGDVLAKNTLSHPGNTTATMVLTVPLGVGITVSSNALLAVGGMFSGESGGYTGQTYSQFGQIALEGSIDIASGGRLSCCGYITGSGSITVAEGGEVYEPFVICDYNGGSYTVVSYLGTSERIMPFQRFAMFNIQAGMTLKSGANLYGYACLHTGAFSVSFISLPARYNYSTVKIVGETGALLLTDGADIEMTHSAGTVSGYEGVGNTCLRIKGGTVELGIMEFTVTVATYTETVSSEELDFPVPFNLTVDIESGSTLTIPATSYVKIMGGATVYVREGATLNVEGKLGLYDGTNTLKYEAEASAYPEVGVLQEAGLSARGRLIVDGTMNIGATGIFGGLVESSQNTGEVVVNSGATLEATLVDGVKATDSYMSLVSASHDSYTSRTLAAQLCAGSGVIDMTAGETYYAASTTDRYAVPGFSYTKSDESVVSYTYDGTEEAAGKWVTHFTIRFYDTNGDQLSEYQKIPGADLSDVAAPGIEVPDGYALSWNPALSTLPAVMPRADLDFYPVLTKEEYSITYDLDGGSWGSETVRATYTVDDAFTLPTPVRTGYTFDGWTGSNGTTCQTTVTIPIGTTGDLSYTANWTAKKVNVVFMSDGKEYSSSTVDFGSYVTAVAVETNKTGHTFDSWYLDEACTQPATFPYLVSTEEDVVFYAKWIADTYKVTFASQGGSDVESLEIPYGGLVTKPGDPTREYYEFGGWYLESDCTNAVDFGTYTVTGDVTFYAKWTAKEAVIIYYANDGTETFKTQTATAGSVTLEMNTFARTGYNFNGWNTKADGTGTAYSNMSSLSGVEGELKLYAQWRAYQYTVTLDANGGNLDGETGITVAYDNAYGTLPTPTRTGYAFLGWYTTDGTESPDTGVQITAETIVSATAAHSLYARWTLSEYEITYVLGDGVSDPGNPTGYNSEDTFTLKNPSRTGYTFAGWTGSNGTTCQTTVTIPIGTTGDLTYTANWTVNQYTMTFNTAGGTAIDAITQDYGTAITAPADPTRTGYTFDGWDKEIPSTMPAENVTITAQWTVNQYTMTFNTAGGTAVAAITQDYGTSVAAPTAPTRTGYTFAGWEDASGNAVTFPVTMPAENTAYTAIWTANSCTINFSTNGGTEVAAVTADYDSQITAPDAPTKTGYIFDGWYLDSGLTDKVSFPYTVAGSTTFYAKWIAATYTVTLNANGGSCETETITVTYGATYSGLPTPTREGYNFQGWLLDGTKITEGQTVVSVAGDHTLTASWQAATITVIFMDGYSQTPVATFTQSTGTTFTVPTVSRTGYLFAGWSVDGETVTEVSGVVPTKNTTYTALWTSYLSMLVGLDSESFASDAALLATARSYYNLMDSEQKADYSESYSDHQTALFEAIEAVATAELKASVVTGAQNIADKELLVVNNTTVATLCVNGGQVDIRIDSPETEAIYLLTPAFLPELLNSVDIKSVRFDDLQEDGYDQDVYLVSDINSNSQTELMVRVAMSALRDNEIIVATAESQGYLSDGKLSYDEFFNCLSSNQDITVGVMDGESVDITVLAETVEGVAYEVSYTLNFYNLSHDANWLVDGEVYHSAQYDEGEAIAAPTTDPTKEGYTFAGWTGYDAAAVMGRVDVSYTASWTANQYTVTLDANGGSCDTQTITVTYDSTFGTLPTPTRAGYKFAGWQLNGSIVDENTRVTITASATLVAQWATGDSSSIQYDLAGGSWGSVTGRATYTVEDAFTLPTPVRTGYTFVGWTGSNGDEPQITVTISKGTTGDLSYTANWSAIDYTVTWMVDNEVYSTQTYTYGDAISAPADPAKEGHTFAGWEPAVESVMGTVDLTYTATWSVNDYTITWIVDGVTVKSETAKYGTTVVTPDAPTKEGYTFAGWEGYTAGDTVPAEDLTYTARWTINTHTVTWNVDGETTTVDYTYGQTISAPADPAKEGHTFAGWDGYTDGMTMPDRDVEFTAAWNVNSYTVTWMVDGEVYLTQTYEYGQTITKPEVNPEKEGYDFNGWDPAVASVMPAEHLTYTAQWTASGDTPYTVYHYQQTVDGTGYEQVETVDATGATNSSVSAQWKTYTGFKANTEKSTVSGTITADGGLELHLYYDRESYTVTWKVGQTVTQTYLYGQTLIIPETDYEDIHASYTFKSWDVTLPETVTGNATYTASYTADYDVAVVDSTVTYRTLELALANAVSGILRLEKDVTLTADAVVPSGVTLLLPCKDSDTGYEDKDGKGMLFNPDGTSSASGAGVGSGAYLYRTLTIPEGITLSVSGTVMVNSVSGRKATAASDQDIVGGYAQILLSGDISVLSGGTVDCFGYIKGEGTVTAENGGTVGDLFLVRNWRGGHQALAMYNNDIYPMNQFDCRNIESTVVIKYGGVYNGLVKMYGNNAYHYTRFPQIHVSNGIIRPNTTDSYVVRTYEDGREIYTIYGGADFAESTLTLLGQTVSTSSFIYPIEGDTEFILNSGSCSFLEDFKFLPGSKVVVNSGASLTVEPGAKIVFYTEFNDLDNYADTEYPSDYGPAALYVMEGASFTNGGIFGGRIYTETGDIFVKQGSYIVDAVGNYAKDFDDVEVFVPLWGGQEKTFTATDKWGDTYTVTIFADTLEANGYRPSATDEEDTVTIQHPLEIYRDGYSWRISDAALGSDDYGSIIWVKNDELVVEAEVTTTATGAEVSVTVENTWSEAKSGVLWVAAYDINGKMIAVEMVDSFTVAAWSSGEESVTITTDETICSISVFFLDSDFCPMAEAKRVPLN